MEEFGTIVTRIGLAKIANAVALGEKVDLKYMAFGDGDGSIPNLDESMTELVNEQFRGEINNVETIDDTNIKVTKVIPPNIGGFWIREIGVFDSDNDLIAIGAFPTTYKPNIEDGATKDIRAELIITVSNVDSIVLKIDPYVVTATLKDLDNLREDINNQIEESGISDDEWDEIETQIDKKANKYIKDIGNNNEFELIFKNNTPYFRVERVVE